MGGNVLVDLGLFLVVFDDLPKPLAAHPLSIHVDKESFFVAAQNDLGPDVPDIVLQRLHRSGIQGDEPLPAPTGTPQYLSAEIHVVQIQGDQLADPNAGGI